MRKSLLILKVEFIIRIAAAYKLQVGKHFTVSTHSLACATAAADKWLVGYRGVGII